MDFLVKDATEREALCGYLRSLPDGKQYDVSVKLHRSKRSNPQNAWYWTIVGIVARETDNDKEVIHKFFARKFVGVDVKEMGGEKIALVRSTSTLNTEEFSEFISKVEAFVANELGIILPDPSSPIYNMIANNE
jgi:hypothetical protein